MRYNEELEKAKLIDLQILGLGHNGHIGFNEPDHSLISGTHLVELKQETRAANARFFASIDDVPREALTMGVGTILKAKTILLVVRGADKAEIVHQALTGPITTELPASLLQTHPHLVVLMDAEAGRFFSMNSLVIQNAQVVTEQRTLHRGTVYVQNGLIQSISSDRVAKSDFAEAVVIDADGSWLLPGFIDVHVHGGYGADFMDASSDSLDTITRFHAASGTTSMLATTMTAPHGDIERVLQTVQRYMSGPMPYAQLLGVHLEGPFISPRWPGAQNVNHITLPQRAWLEDWHERYPQLVRQLTLAPEREGALELIAWLRDHGIVAACGHTDANYADIQSAVREGLSHAVHTFNAMKGLHHREPGTVGAVLADSRISGEVIADGQHVHPAAIRLLEMAKQPHGLLLITDAMSAAGLGDGAYELGGQAVTVQAGVARLTEGGALAGSTLTMIGALRYMVREVGVSVEDASRYASGNPARLLRLDERLGSIAPGKQADLLLVSPELELQQVWVQGKAMQMQL
ncbi:N-acetylglucosamine-6-phosphate deacetylase [Paenibacillus hexagrammi]|uniref:N-acetylglucosamine-6-phosphate deacetylase n=1 Tax=Paenibacillus hexagrammi TaxID=2908839 RepID=A0ABY3SRU9_9BACL|nr:N-acetylglucosamine-6-phosphate deacetylase [Paenibacillus sp. YPD9-1]